MYEIGGPAVESLIPVLKDKHSRVRSEAAVVLGNIKDPRAVEPLIAAIKDTQVRWDAARALVKIGGPAVEPLIAALKDKDRLARQGAAAVLFEIKSR